VYWMYAGFLCPFLIAAVASGRFMPLFPFVVALSVGPLAEADWDSKQTVSGMFYRGRRTPSYAFRVGFLCGLGSLAIMVVGVLFFESFVFGCAIVLLIAPCGGMAWLVTVAREDEALSRSTSDRVLSSLPRYPFC
jgi:hypothetical protein